MKRFKIIALVLLPLFILSALELTAADKKKLIVGVAPGPYGDIFKLGVKSGLEKKGYEVELKEFSDYVQPNLALSNKSIDLNVFQHGVYLEKFSADKGLKLSPVITIPTAALGLYSKKFKTADVKNGATITIANDPSNLARALVFLQSLNLLKIKVDVDPAKASEKDIAENPKKLVIQPLEAAQLPRTLDSADYSVVNGNYAISAGIYSTALKRETLEEKYINLIAVRTDDLNAKFVKDIKEIVESKAFLAVINDPKNGFSDFQKPAWLKKKSK
jgi:D-methionine transport system substrate-binding protein